jgi:putative ABC transport system permease protein
LSELIQDLKFGFRTLCRSPGFAIVALLTIGLGIGANASIFSYIDGALLRPLPYPDADRMVRVLEKPPGGGTNRMSAPDYLDYLKESTVFQYMTAQQWNTAPLTGIDIPIQVPNERVSVDFFDVFKTVPLLGRSFAPGEDQVGRDHVAVISHAFWVTQFASDPAIIGKTFLLDGDPYTVIGVMPAGTFDRTSSKLWRPAAFSDNEMHRYAHRFGAWATLKPGVTLEQARTQLDAIALRIAHDFPDTNKGWGVAIDPLASILVRSDVRRSLYLLMASVAMVLLIACANLANLTLARAVSREREVAIRAALGAGRWRLMRQFLTESLLLSVTGGALGLSVAFAGLAGLKRVVPSQYLPPGTYVEMDGRILLFVLGLAILTGLTFGIYPALKASRPNLTNSLKQGGQGASAGRSSQGARSALVTTEVALAFVLLSGAGLLIHSFFKLQHVDTGFDATNVVTARLPISYNRFTTAEQLGSYLRRIKDRLGALPGVRDVALTTALPMEGGGFSLPFLIAGSKTTDMSHRPDCYFKIVSPAYFHALGMRLTRGRLLDDHDLNGAAPVTVINETMARKYFKGVEPLGQHIMTWRIQFGSRNYGDETPWEVVGVVADEKLRGLSAEGDDGPGMYVSTDQSLQQYESLVLRSAGDPHLLIRAMPLAIHEVDANQTLDRLRTLEQTKSESVGEERLQSLLLGIFAAMALLLSAIGLYGLLSYSVLQRTREIGIRTALGATSGNIIWLVVRSGLTLTVIGLLIGFAGSYGVAQVLSSMLFEVGEYDPTTLCVTVVLLLTMALLACYIPAKRAVRVSPTVALRQD